MAYVPVEWRDAGPGRQTALYRGAILEAWTYGPVGKYRVVNAETNTVEATGETYSPASARGAARETWDRILRRREVTDAGRAFGNLLDEPRTVRGDS